MSATAEASLRYRWNTLTRRLATGLRRLSFALSVGLLLAGVLASRPLRAQTEEPQPPVTPASSMTGRTSPDSCTSGMSKRYSPLPPAPDPCQGVEVDECGNPILPQTAYDIVVGPEEETEDGPVNQLYPGINTSVDDWYEKVDRDSNGCPFSLGGTVPERQDPTIPGIPDPPALNLAIEKAAAQLPQMLHFSGPFPKIVPDNYVYVPTSASCGNVYFYREHPSFCNQLLTGSPFQGKDIIYVHGLDVDALYDVVVNGAMLPKWPDVPAAFAPGGYWRVREEAEYWDQPAPYSHIDNFLRNRNGVPRNANNRYVIVAYSSIQSMDTAANVVLNQIADAMVNGNGIRLLNPSDPRSTLGFCQDGCIIISHSSGAPVSDVAMAFAADPIYQQQTGPIGFIPQHVKVHAALGGAFSGSQWATDTMVLAYLLYQDPGVCVLVQYYLNLPNSSFCFALPLLRESILWDLVPQVMQSNWFYRISSTPVPVVTVAGAHEDYNWPYKFFFQRGFDDGVVTMDSACGRTIPIWQWPSGFFESIPGANLLDPRLVDMHFTGPRRVRPFAEQNYEFAFSWPPFDVFPRAAGACALSENSLRHDREAFFWILHHSGLRAWPRWLLREPPLLCANRGRSLGPAVED